MGGFPSGQRGQTVNLLSTTSKVRILLHPVIIKKEAGMIIIIPASLCLLFICLSDRQLLFCHQSRHGEIIIWLVKVRQEEDVCQL